MTSSRPYFIRAVYEWLADNSLTPYIYVNSGFPNVHVPQEFVTDGNIVLNISMAVVMDLEMNNHEVSFKARFNGIQNSLNIPIMAIKSIYACEDNKYGMDFNDDDLDADPPKPSSQVKKGKFDKKPPFLRIVD